MYYIPKDYANYLASVFFTVLFDYKSALLPIKIFMVSSFAYFYAYINQLWTFKNDCLSVISKTTIIPWAPL